MLPSEGVFQKPEWVSPIRAPALPLTSTHCFGIKMQIHSPASVTLNNLDSVYLSNLSFDFSSLFQSTEWLASPPTSCTHIKHYLCVRLCPLSAMLLSFLPPFSSLTHTCTSGLSPFRSILWLDLKFQFPSHLPSSCSSRAGAESYLSSYLRKKPDKCWMNKGLLPHGSCWSGTDVTSLSFLKGHWIWGKLSGVP